METSMTIATFIKGQAKNLCSKVYIAPDIPDKKLNSGITGITLGEVNPDYVLAIADTSLFGSGKEGCLFTGESIYIKGLTSRNKIEIKLSNIKSAEHLVEIITKDNGKVAKKEKLILIMEGGEEKELTGDLTGIKLKELSYMFNEIANMGARGVEFTNSSQSMPISMMNSEIKKSYLRILCNFAYSDDNMVNSQEYAEITSLMVRIEVSSEDRIEMRNYMLDQSLMISNEELLNALDKNLKENQFEIVKKSLIKDMLYINRKINREEEWKDNQYIMELQKLLGIHEDQINIIYEAIINDEDILLMRKNDSEIEKSIKDMASKTAAVGVPLAAIYLSGSVVGISAAGITSGLATLGMGGLLGFSSMFTGIGVAVLLGIGTYKGLKKVTGIGDLENNKQRELMLQEIIINSQRSLDMMIEDVNAISVKLTEALEGQVETEVKIRKLSDILGMLTKGAKLTSDHINYAETEKIIAKLPMKLDITRLIELTNTPTTSKYREIVLSCYISTGEIQGDGSGKIDYILDDEMPMNDLKNLAKILDFIGYNNLADASVASLKGNTKKLMNNILGE